MSVEKRDGSGEPLVKTITTAEVYKAAVKWVQSAVADGAKKSDDLWRSDFGNAGPIPYQTFECDLADNTVRLAKFWYYAAEGKDGYRLSVHGSDGDVIAWDFEFGKESKLAALYNQVRLDHDRQVQPARRKFMTAVEARQRRPAQSELGQ